LRPGDEIVTYVARNLEHYRGFHIFMRALPAILGARPQARVVIVGGDEVSYGPRPSRGTTWRQILLQELAGRLDVNRVHFVGRVPHARFVELMQVSAAHVYLTYPFVLSWSFVEALAAGCLVIGSSTAPVLEVLKDGQNGLTVDFFDAGDLARRIDEVFEHPDRLQGLRDAARVTAVRDFDLESCILPQWVELIDDLVNGETPRVLPPVEGLATRASLR
jgi:glycosyltransferase involved in cell wall biosynthesis